MDYINTHPQSQAEQDAMLGYEPSPLYAGGSADVTSAKKDWAAAAQYYWARAYFLMTNGEFKAMATVAKEQAIKAENRANAGELAIALAGGMPACKDADAIRLGAGLDAREVAQAKAAVMAKAEAMGAFKTPADYRRERHEANKAETAKWRAEQAAKREADAPARAERVAAAQAAKADAKAAKAAAEAQKAADKVAKVAEIMADHFPEGRVYTRAEAVKAADAVADAKVGVGIVGDMPAGVPLMASVVDAYGKTAAAGVTSHIYITWVDATAHVAKIAKAEAIAQALANGAIEIDGVILCEDGTEILI